MMEKVFAKLREEFKLEESDVSYRGQSNEFVTLSGSNSSFDLNCYYEKSSKINFNLVIVPSDKNNRFIRTIPPENISEDHEDYIVKWIDYVSHEFSKLCRPVNLINLFQTSNVKAYDLRYLAFPGLLEFDIFLSGYANLLSKKTTIYSFRHVSDNSVLSKKEPFRVSYSYAFFMDLNRDNLNESQPDSYGSAFHPEPSHWIFYLDNSINARTVEQKLNNSNSQKAMLSLVEFDIEFTDLKQFLIEKGALPDENVCNISIETEDLGNSFMNYLSAIGFIHDSESHILKLQNSNNTVTYPNSRKDLITSQSSDPFYKDLELEINISWRLGLFSSTLVLSRKYIENLIIDLLRNKYPVSNNTLNIYFNDKQNRFHDFSYLLENLKQRKSDFKPDVGSIEKLLILVNPFKTVADATVHSIIENPEENDIIKLKIPQIISILEKLL